MPSNAVYPIIEKRLSRLGWNKRVLGADDFDLFCHDEGIFVFEGQYKWDGLYIVRSGIPVIYIQQSLRPIERLIVGWHEVGHHILHAPEFFFYSYGRVSKADYQAHICAACALIPQPLYLKRSAYDIQEEYGYPSDLLRFRARLFETLGV
ncbi:MAG: ImmA/IrrE family metallo-endopeptidase [Acidobacteriota bacterium]